MQAVDIRSLHVYFMYFIFLLVLLKPDHSPISWSVNYCVFEHCHACAPVYIPYYIIIIYVVNVKIFAGNKFRGRGTYTYR